MAIENDGIVVGQACAWWDDESLATRVTPLVTITSAEYRELCGKAALWDEYRADVERWTGGEADA